MTNRVNTNESQDRSSLEFERHVLSAFTFLETMGFVKIEALPTLVRYRKDDLEVDVYHGRQSYEIGAGIARFDTRYSMSEIIRSADPDAARRYRNAVATTPEDVAEGLEELSSLMKVYGAAALQDDSQFFSTLEIMRKRWSDEYAIEVLAYQLRPKAEDAFRRGDYVKAAELYARIRPLLSPVEIGKLSLAEERSKR